MSQGWLWLHRFLSDSLTMLCSLGYVTLGWSDNTSVSLRFKTGPLIAKEKKNLKKIHWLFKPVHDDVTTLHEGFLGVGVQNGN